MSVTDLEPRSASRSGPAQQSWRSDPRRQVTLRRLRGPVTFWCLAAAAVAAVGQTLGTVIAGWITEDPRWSLVWLLAASVVGAALLDTWGKVAWSTIVDRAEGLLRADLLSAALSQPLSVMSEQAVGEILDRVDDDTHELGNLLRWMGWQTIRTLLRLVPMWVVAGITWWPAWVLFPVAAVVTVLVVLPLSDEIARRKVAEEIAWTDHAAAMEEGVAARDDLRSSLGQAYLLRRCAELSAEVHARFAASCRTAAQIARRATMLLHGLLATVAVAGVVLVETDRLSVGELVTLFLVTTTFVGQIDHLMRRLPDLQAGLGALARLRSLLEAPPEPEGGEPVPEGSLDVSVRELSFAYDEGTFRLSDIDLHIPAGSTVALVGRTGSGKSTLAALLSRAIEPPRGSVLLGGVDVRDLDLQRLRSAVGVVTQRTEILAATLAENITLFAPVPRSEVEAAVTELGLGDWVEGLEDGLDTRLGPGGTTLSAGEEQLVAFARLLVRHVKVVVLDEATARMDPVTEARVVRAADRLLTGRTGVLIAHRLSTTARAAYVAVMDHGRVVQHGPRAELASADGPFRDLLRAAGEHEPVAPEVAHDVAIGSVRRAGGVREAAEVGTGPRLARATVSMLKVQPWWGLGGAALFLVSALMGAFGAVTGYLWGQAVEDLKAGDSATIVVALLVASLIAGPLLVTIAFRVYPQWWVAVLLRVRTSVLRGQTMQRRLPRTPAGEVVGRALDADRFPRYADRWVDLLNGVGIVLVTALASWSVLAGVVLLAVLVVSATVSAMGSPAAGRSAAAASKRRAEFGRSLVSALESARTVKLAAATDHVHRHLREVDDGRVDAAVREHRIQAFLDGVPAAMVQCGVVAAWAVHLAGGWGVGTALLVMTAVNGFDWFGRVAGMVITEAPGVRAWAQATSRLAGGVDLMDVPDEVDLVRGTAPVPPLPPRTPLERLEIQGLTAVHEDGTLGVSDVDLTVGAGQLVLLLGPIGSGKSSLLSALAGLIDHSGSVRWNGVPVDDPQVFLRPGQVSYVAQVPRVLSGTFADNVRLDHDRTLERAVEDARMSSDIEEAGGVDSLVGHRGVRLSGGQVQRLALARALATEAELVLADDVSSALDARTEVELWNALRQRGVTVLGSTSKRAALAQADTVVVLDEGRVAAVGPWSELSADWSHLAG